MKNILIIGGAGYIGSHTTKYLLDKGFKIIVYDNLSKGHKEFIDNKVKFVKGELFDKENLNQVFKNNNVDAVVHFAAFIEAGESVVNPLKYYETNVLGSLSLFDCMLENGVKKIVFSSSAAVYGQPKKMPITENMKKEPTNPYGQTKLIVENILMDFDKAYGLKSVCLRYFNAAGAGYDLGEWHEPETHLIPLVLKTALGKRDSIKIFGTDYDTKDGTCIRDYIHILDLAKAHYLALKKLLDDGNSAAYNLGNGLGYSVREVINISKKITKIDFKVEECDRRKGDPAELIANYDKIKKELSWEPEYNLDDIIKTAWEWHKRNDK